MSLDLSSLVVPDSSGLGAPIVTCVIEGILDEEDLRALALGAEAGPPSSLQIEPEDPSDLKKIREKHHSVARSIASGMSQRMVASISGYTESYLSILLNSPAMKELVEMYRIQQGSAAAVISEKLKTVGLKAVEALEERMDEGKLNNQELLGAAKLGLDRGGHGPQSKHHHTSETHIVDYVRIAELQAEARRRNGAFIVPVGDIRQALLPQPQQPGPEGEAE